MKRPSKKKKSDDVLVGQFFVTGFDAEGRQWHGQVLDFVGYREYGIRMYLIERWLPGGESPRKTVLSGTDFQGWEFSDAAPEVPAPPVEAANAPAE